MAKKKKVLSDAEFDAIPDSQVRKGGKISPISDDDFDSLPDEKPSDRLGDAEAFLQSTGNAATLGYAPHIAAAIGGLIPDPNADIDEKLRSEGFKIEQPEDTYVSRRDENIKRQEKLGTEHPLSSLAGTVAGSLAPGVGMSKAAAAIPGMAKGGGLLARLGKSAIGGAATAAVMNPGDIEGEISPLQLGERAENAKTGALVGAATQGAGEVLKKGADLILGMPQRMKDYAALKAFKSTGAMLKDFRQADARGQIQKIGEEMLEKGLVKPGYTFEDVAEQSGELKQKAGALIGDLYDAAETELAGINPAALPPAQQAVLAQTSLNPARIADEIHSSLKGELAGKAGGKKALATVEGILEDLRTNGDVEGNISVIQEFKEGLDDIIKYNRDLSQEPLAKQYLFKVRDALKNKVQGRIDALDQVLGGNRLESLKDANQQYGMWANVNRISNDRVMREGANKFMSLTDTIAGAGGAAAGGVVGQMMTGNVEGAAKGAAIGGAMSLANKGMRLYGAPLAATGAQAIGKAGSMITAPIQAAVNPVANAMVQNPVATGSIGANVFNKPHPMARDPLAALGDSPDNVQAAMDAGLVDEQAIKTLTGTSGKMTRETLIKAQRMLKSPQGRKALAAAMMQLESVDNPESALGPVANQFMQGGGQ